MKLPDRLANHRGTALATARVITFPGGSVLGTHTVLLTDEPALYVHDTGGILGEERYLAAEPFAPSDEQLFLLNQSDSLRGTYQFNGKLSVSFEVSDEVMNLTATLCPHSVSNGLFDSGLPISVRCDFEGDRGDALAKLQSDTPDLPTERIGHAIKAYTTPWKFSATTLALANHAVVEEFPARIRIERGRLLLLWQQETLADLPLAHLAIKRMDKRQVYVATATLVCGQSAKSISLWFQSPAAADDFMLTVENMDVSDKSSRGPLAIANSIALEGRGPHGEPLDGCFDALLTENALELRSSTDELLHRFEFLDDALRIAGTSEAFLIADATAGPIQVSIQDSNFQRRIHDHPRVKACAEHSLTAKPFPVRIDGELSSIDVRDGAIRLTRASGDASITIGQVARIEVNIPSSCLSITLTEPLAGEATKADLVIEGQLALLAGLHSSITSEIFAAKQLVEGEISATNKSISESYIRAILGRESEYFLYAIFGPFYELHAAMCQTWGRRGEMHALALPEAPKAQIEIATFLAQAKDQLLRHLDMVAFYLPSFLVSCDTKQVPTLDASLIKRHELSYRSILSQPRQLYGELASMREHLLRIEGVKTSLGKGYGGASISLAAASIVAPFFLMSSVQQALGAYSHNKAQSDAATDSLRRVLDKWNYWIETLLPALSHHVIESLFPLRGEIAQQTSLALADQTTQARTTRHIAERLAKLETYLLFPEEASAQHKRGEIVNAIKAARARLRYSGFQSF